MKSKSNQTKTLTACVDEGLIENKADNTYPVKL